MILLVGCKRRLTAGAEQPATATPTTRTATYYRYRTRMPQYHTITTLEIGFSMRPTLSIRQPAKSWTWDASEAVEHRMSRVEPVARTQFHLAIMARRQTAQSIPE